MQKSILRDFEKNFQMLVGEKIVLYGTGQYTELVVKNVCGFNIVGLADARRTGEEVYGLPVMSMEEIASQQVKTIIIIANLSVAPDIYERIRTFTEKHEIAVYYMNGRRAGLTDKEITECEYWDIDRETLLHEIAENDVISFDLFDTLIARKCLLPTEVFWILEREAEKKGILLADFVEQRQRAEKYLYHNINLFYKLHDIYLYLREFYGLTVAEADELEHMELQIEQKMIVTRVEMCEVFETAKRLKKEVIICTDTYLSEKQIVQILDKWDLCPDKLYISCEAKASKHIGNLYEQIVQTFRGKRILHIGDNLRSDIENAGKHGLNTFYIANAAKMLDYTKCSKWREHVQSFAERYTYDLWAQRAFQDPFCGAHARGKILLEDMKQYGYLFFGPLVLGYMSWLFNVIKNQQLDAILFVSRDGYLFYNIYEKIREKTGDANIPPAIYFLTSRRAASVAAIHSKQDIEFVIRKVCNIAGNTLKELLQKAFGIVCDEDDSCRDERVGDMGKDMVVCHVLKRYQDRILKKAAHEREQYHQYIGRMGMNHYKRVGMMNFVGRGVTQKCLSKIVEGTELVGLYFALEYEADEILEGETALSWYPQRMSTHTATDNLFINYLFGEMVFTAPHGQFMGFDEAGNPVFAQENADYEGLRLCHEGIRSYIEDMLELFPKVDEIAINSGFADELLGMLDRERIIFNREMLKYFAFQDYYNGK